MTVGASAYCGAYALRRAHRRAQRSWADRPRARAASGRTPSRATALRRSHEADVGAARLLEIGDADHDVVNARKHRYASRAQDRRMRGV